MRMDYVNRDYKLRLIARAQSYPVITFIETEAMKHNDHSKWLQGTQFNRIYIKTLVDCTLIFFYETFTSTDAF